MRVREETKMEEGGVERDGWEETLGREPERERTTTRQNKEE